MNWWGQAALEDSIRVEIRLSEEKKIQLLSTEEEQDREKQSCRMREGSKIPEKKDAEVIPGHGVQKKLNRNKNITRLKKRMDNRGGGKKKTDEKCPYFVYRGKSKLCSALCFLIARVSRMSSHCARQQLCNFGAVDQAYEVCCRIRTISQQSRETFSALPHFFP